MMEILKNIGVIKGLFLWGFFAAGVVVGTIKVNYFWSTVILFLMVMVISVLSGCIDFAKKK